MLNNSLFPGTQLVSVDNSTGAEREELELESFFPVGLESQHKVTSVAWRKSEGGRLD